MSPASITNMHLRKIQWAIAALMAVCSLGLGWYWGGRSEIYWSMERERLHALVEYSQKVHVGSPIAEKAQLRRCGLDGGATAARDGTFTVYMIGYGEDSCCTDDACGQVALLVRSWGGRIVMIQDIENARSFGVRAVVDARGGRLADRLVAVTDSHATVKGIFRNLDSHDLDAALRY